jgi:hypothetical protein
MTDTEDRTYRSLYDPPADSVTLRDAEQVENDDGMMEVRMPIASTGAVRNEGDEPLTRNELAGMATQVDDLTRGVFPEHGAGDKISGGHYSQFEKLGYWAGGDVQREASDDGEDLLIATARMPDPETLPAATGDYREALAILKEQAKRGIPISASIGWRADEDAPGGNDLMEASIVGVGADPRTSTEGGTEALARAAVEAGADPDEFVQEVREIVASTSDTDAPEDTDMDTHEMSDTSDTPDDGGTTDTEQTADDGETTERAPGDVGPDDLARLVAASYEGVSADDLVEAWGEMGEFTGGVDLDALADVVSIVTDADDAAVMDAMESLMDGDSEEQKGDEYDDEEDDDEEEQSVDEPESEQSTEDADDERDTDTSGLEERIADLEDALESVRTGETDVETPETPDAEEEQDADGDDAETRDVNDDDRAPVGPNWRSN